MRRALVLAALVGAGCGGDGGGVLVLTVNASGRVSAVESLRIAVSSNGQAAAPILIKLAGGPAEIPPARTLNLAFPPGRSGAVSLGVEALGSDGRTIASGAGSGTIAPGEQSAAAVTLAGVEAVDMSGSTDGAHQGDVGATQDSGDPADGSLPGRFTLRGSTSGIGAGRSTGGSFAVSGTIGVPQPRVASTGGKFTLLPLVPGPRP